MKVALLADFGSTFTKVIAVDLADGALVGTAQAPTSLNGEILDGYEEAARAALRDAGGQLRLRPRWRRPAPAGESAWWRSVWWTA